MSDDGARDESRFAVGMMSGTSIDGLDAALVRIDGGGLDMRVSLIRWRSEPLGDLGPRLRAIAEQKPVTAEEVATVAWHFGELHVAAIARLLATCSSDHEAESPMPAVIAVHGQTVFHRPPISWQLINDAPIRARWPEAIVKSDLRQHDLARGGQGAPITPLADWIIFRDETRSRAIVNLGGFCNITILPASQRASGNATNAQGLPCLGAINGFDVCACNHILDTIARETLNVRFDVGGRRAMAGSPDPLATDQLVETLIRQRAMDRSLGTGDEVAAWVRAYRARMSPDDLAATAASAVARAIARALDDHDTDQVVLAGGGALNEALTSAIARHTKRETLHSDALGIAAQAREATAMAILGTLHADGVPITLPQVTGRRVEQSG